jgi:hypothetical protein
LELEEAYLEKQANNSAKQTDRNHSNLGEDRQYLGRDLNCVSHWYKCKVLMLYGIPLPSILLN